MTKDRKKLELLFSVSIHDCEVQTFRSGGPGGQLQNKVESGVRVIHRQSGAIGESREMRSQYSNKQRAFRRMAESDKFQKWAKIEVARCSGEPSIESKVRKTLSSTNLRIDVKNGKGCWIVNNELLPTEQEIDVLFE